jgi:hypothetical protein
MIAAIGSNEPNTLAADHRAERRGADGGGRHTGASAAALAVDVGNGTTWVGIAQRSSTHIFGAPNPRTT